MTNPYNPDPEPLSLGLYMFAYFEGVRAAIKQFTGRPAVGGFSGRDVTEPGARVSTEIAGRNYMLKIAILKRRYR